MISKTTLAYFLGVSERTIHRAMKRAGVKEITENNINDIVKYIDNVKIIYDTSGKKIIVRRDGGIIEFQKIFGGKENEMTQMSDSQTFMSKVEEILLKQNEILTEFLKTQEAILQNIATQTKTLTEAILKLAQKQLPPPNLNEKKKKHIELAIRDYITTNSLYYNNFNDVFLDLLERFETETGKKVKEQYQKEDRTYMNTIIRLGLDADFIEFIRRKI